MVGFPTAEDAMVLLLIISIHPSHTQQMFSSFCDQEHIAFELDEEYDPRHSGILPFHFGSNGSKRKRFWKFILGSFFQKVSFLFALYMSKNVMLLLL